MGACRAPGSTYLAATSHWSLQWTFLELRAGDSDDWRLFWRKTNSKKKGKTLEKHGKTRIFGGKWQKVTVTPCFSCVLSVPSGSFVLWLLAYGSVSWPVINTPRQLVVRSSQKPWKKVCQKTHLSYESTGQSASFLFISSLKSPQKRLKSHCHLRPWNQVWVRA